MATASDTIKRFPHITFREVEGRREPYVSDTGLAVWEIALLARGYSDDADMIGHETFTNPDLVEEGLRYAAEHRVETNEEISRHTVDSVEELQERFPGLPILVIDISPD